MDISKDQYKSLNNKYITCICPKCGNGHKKKMSWTGRGIPRIFCSTCNDISRRVGDSDPNIMPQFSRKPSIAKEE